MTLNDKIEMLSKKYGQPKERFGKRLDGRIEWFCEHGVGHTVWFLEGLNGIHGCDSCCRRLQKGDE